MNTPNNFTQDVSFIVCPDILSSISFTSVALWTKSENHLGFLSSDFCQTSCKWYQLAFLNSFGFKHILVERIDSQNLAIHNKCNVQDNSSLLWRHNERGIVSNHQHYDSLLKRLYRCRLKKTSKLRVTGLCVRNSSVTDEFRAQWVSNAEKVSIWWRYHV